MIRIWVVLAIAIGVISIVLAPYTVNFFRDVYGLTVTVPEIVREGMFLVVSGIAALVSSVLLKMTKMFWVCLICCVVAALTSYPGMGGFSGVITAAIGMYMALAIARCRPAFKS